ncbi:hypothetical protein BJ742DRAFT_520340 [Cladochytrium replicatum]|nr:hypothetical protein BJ742DRAFT_520340 [Cladochytrium replicatum]
MVATSKFGLIDYLDWWKQSGLELKRTTSAIDDASVGGRVVYWLGGWHADTLKLQWIKQVAMATFQFYNSGRMVVWSASIQTRALCWASCDANFEVFGMRRISGSIHIFKWMEQAERGRVDVGARVVERSSLECKYSSNSMDVKVLEWWRTSGLDFKFSAKAGDCKDKATSCCGV